MLGVRLKKTFKLVTGIAELFRSLIGPSFSFLLSFAAAAKVLRFLSFLLPFKALIVASDKNLVLQLQGYEISNISLAASILLFALFSFFAYTYFNAKLSEKAERSLFRALAVSSNNQFYQGTTVGSIARELSDSIEFYSNIFIALVLCVSLAVVLPVGLALNTGLLLMFVLWLQLRHFSEAISNQERDATSFVERFGFFSQVVVLIGLGVWLTVSPNEHFLKIVFAFIATRQFWAHASDIARQLHRSRNRYWPTYFDNEREDRAIPLTNNHPYLVELSPEQWFSKALKRSGIELNEIRYLWRDLHSRSVHSFFVSGKEGSTNKFFLLQIYNRRNHKLAEAECGISSQRFKDHKYLWLHSETILEGYRIVIYEHQSLKQISRPEFEGVLTRLLCDMWQTTMNSTEAIVEEPIYINPDAVKQLSTVAIDSSERQDVEFVLQNLNQITAFVKKMPTSIHDPELSSRSVLKSEVGDLFMGPTTRTVIMPIGAFLWRVKHMNLVDLDLICEELHETRDDCQAVRPEHLRLVAHFHGLDKNLSNGFLSRAIGEATAIAELLNECALLLEGSRQTPNYRLRA